MESYPVTISKKINAPLQNAWNALFVPKEMKKWYFDIPGFKPEVGFEFSFKGGTEKRLYIHLCKVTEVVFLKKISYTWKYKDIKGNSQVTFDFAEEGSSVIITLTHSGLETFPAENPDLAWERFYEGWSYIIGTSLPGYLEKNNPGK